MIFNATHKRLFWSIIAAYLLLQINQLSVFPNTVVPDDLVINEFVTQNETGLTDKDGDYSDWIEIYNPSRRTISLAGWFLTDDPGQLEKWALPVMELAGGAYLVVFTSGKNQAMLDSELHTNFRIRRAGEFLALYNTFDQKIIPIDDGGYPAQFKDISYGLYTDRSTYGYFTTPTPGQPNDNAPTWEGIVSKVAFSQSRGIYDQPFQVELSTSTPEATIIYTTDGSRPTETNGTRYEGPLTVDNTTLLRAVALKPNFRPSAINTHTYIFLEQVLNQPQNPAGFPATWGTYSRSYLTYQKGEPVIADYEVDPEIVTDPRYGDLLPEGLTAIPTLSIVTDIKHYDIYANPGERGRDWERPRFR